LGSCGPTNETRLAAVRFEPGRFAGTIPTLFYQPIDHSTFTLYSIF
jgi:hypothetical protein